MDAATIGEQLSENRRKVDFDTYDITVKELVGMVAEGVIDIAPDYQRQFRWSEENQSTFIESVFLGIPVPSLFMAANADGRWELIDGVQRLSTLVRYLGDPTVREAIGRPNALKLSGLEKLSAFNSLSYDELPKSVQLQFSLKPLKVTTISDKSDLNVRFDLFERLNTGGVRLEPQEIRSCIYRGSFNELLKELAKNSDFRKVVRLRSSAEHNATREEFVLSPNPHGHRDSVSSMRTRDQFEQPFLYHAGFSDQGFLYDDAGLLTLVWSSYDPAWQALAGGKHPWTLDSEAWARVEAALTPAPSGGRWRAGNPPRCRRCRGAIERSISDGGIRYVVYPQSLLLTEGVNLHGFGQVVADGVK